MARHLLISDGTSSTGVEAAGAVGIEKLSATGPTQLVASDRIADSKQIRFVQGTATNNIYTPWIYGKDIVDYSGIQYSAPVAATVTDTISGTAAAAGTLELKFVRTDGPRAEFFNIAIATTAVADTAQDLIVKAAYEAATLPDWLNPTCDATAGTTCVFSGAVRGDTAQSGNTWDYGPANIELIIISFDGGTQTHTASKSANPQSGYGGRFDINAFEDANQGTQFGYYNRVQLPNTPTGYAAAANYNMYNIVATKDGSSRSQINGVDNLIEINIALIQGDVDNAIFEGKLNPWMASAGFNQVVIV